MNWKTFLTIKIPTAIVLLTLLIETLAYFLSETPKIRHPLDRLVATMAQLPGNSKTVLFGDSITQDIGWLYEISPQDPIANLTTNQASGLIGSALLLKRYLNIHNPPTRIVIAASPEFFSYSPSVQAAKIYLRSVFEKEQELNELEAAGIDISKPVWTPSILRFENAIVDRAAGLLFSGTKKPQKVSIAEELPPKPSGHKDTEATPSQIKVRNGAKLKLSKSAKYAVRKLCQLSQKHKFEVIFVWAPVPNSVLIAWSKSDNFISLNSELNAELSKYCYKSNILDVNSEKIFPDNSFRDADHLKRPYWTLVYAFYLKKMLFEKKKN